MSHMHPLMQNISELIAYVQHEDPNLDELCQFGVIRTFNFLQPIAMFGAALEGDGSIIPTGQFGFKPEVLKSWQKSSIEEEIPISDALKSNNIVWVANKDQWMRDYPDLAKYENDFTTNTFIAWPISVRGAYMSVLGLCVRSTEAPTQALLSFFETVGGIFALQLSQHPIATSTKEEDELATQYLLFTRRQRDVIHLMAEGLTNQQIASELGFSESTIRQETMRIYGILNAAGRADAIRKFREITASKKA
jgi:DNA-binding CsgD family transcriptional regulator